MDNMITKRAGGSRFSKRSMIGYAIIIGFITIISNSLNPVATIQKEITPIEQVQIKGQIYTLVLNKHKLYLENPETKVTKRLLEEPLLDMVCYDMDQDGKKELLVLTLNQEPSGVEGRFFGKELQFYTLDIEGDLLKPHLIYKNNISSVRPFSLKAGKLEGDKTDTTLFVGVYKDTKYYKEVMNRPFFFSWNGEFIERKWTGSYLSHNELIDLVFVDLTGDGADEIAVLEKTPQGTYQVSLYKWLNFGFDYLITSKDIYSEAGCLKVDWQKGKTQIKIQFAGGIQEEVGF